MEVKRECHLYSSHCAEGVFDTEKTAKIEPTRNAMSSLSALNSSELICFR